MKLAPTPRVWPKARFAATTAGAKAKQGSTTMKKMGLAALAAVAVSSPAVARDHSGYVGLEGGALWAKDINIDAHAVQEGSDVNINNAFRIDFKTGLDLDLIAGYDLGMVRVEGELGYKHAG